MIDILSSNTPSANTHQDTNFQFRFSEQFLDFLKAHNVSIAFSSYGINKLFLIGRQADKEEIATAERGLAGCRALSSRGNGEELLVTSGYQIWRFVNANANPAAQLQAGEHDKVYIPQVGYTTGDCRIQDVGFNKEGEIIFVNTLFNCVAKASETSSFIPLWRPSFISDWVAEDRCHLSGLAFKDGDAQYVTGFSQTNKTNVWQQEQEMEGSGFVMDIKTNEVVCTGLSQPNSPRWYQDKLWLLNAGTSEFGYVDLEKKVFNPIALCQGYAQSLTFCGNFALIAVSLKSQKKGLVSTKLETKLAEQKLSPMCGMQWVDLRTGQSAAAFLAEGIIEEISSISVLANTHLPKLIGFKNDEVYRYMAFDRDAVGAVSRLNTIMN